MKILWLFVVLQTAIAQPGFGTSYLKNSRLCHQWSCISNKLFVHDGLPTPEEFRSVLHRLLPSEDPTWHDVVDQVQHKCYHERARRYSNTCPGQAVMHCAVDELIANCPEAHTRKDDACAPINSLAGFKNMFSQSRYEDVEQNLAVERRPSWFVRNYFNTKCCNLPQLFNSTTLAECGFNTMIQYYLHNPTEESKKVLPYQWRGVSPAPNNGNSLHVVRLSDLPTTGAEWRGVSPAPNNGNSLHVVRLSDLPTTGTEAVTDPLDCCDMSDFINPSWREECKFELNWEAQRRLVIKNTTPVTSTEAIPTTTSRPIVKKDVMIVPQSCEKETCVFTKLKILTPSGVDLDAYTKLLDNLTSSQPTWTSAKGRVVTTCLRKPLTEYEDNCEINKILACTFDVLTENCPYAKKSDLCKKHNMISERVCQISASKYRPKNRREICTLPDLVDRKILTKCGLSSISKLLQVNTIVNPKTYKIFKGMSKCQDLTPSTTCLMSKMGILNKYGFMDYIKMKDHIRRLSSKNEWSALENVFMSAFSNGPLYTEHCNSAKKFLNVVDAMLMTCPDSRRKNTAQCASIFNKVTNTPADTKNVSQEYTQKILDHFHHVFFPSMQSKLTPKIVPKHTTKTKTTPLYNYGILNNNFAPKIEIVDVKPKVTVVPARPLVLLPVYMRVPHSNLLMRPFQNDGVMRTAFSTQKQIAQSHAVPTPPLISTTPSISTTVSTPQPISTTQPISTAKPISTTRFFPVVDEDKFKMIKPE